MLNCWSEVAKSNNSDASVKLKLVLWAYKSEVLDPVRKQRCQIHCLLLESSLTPSDTSAKLIYIPNKDFSNHCPTFVA
uniref:Ovule protein n=1 Tax=Syphacia muris TaxID=451379 RepID=A0A0N5AB73_9BILA